MATKCKIRKMIYEYEYKRHSNIEWKIGRGKIQCGKSNFPDIRKVWVLNEDHK